jgi:tetratricopeptide (TPR) repeat protein
MQPPAAQTSRAASAPEISARNSLSRLNALSAQFASEPEMILAYLEPLAPNSSELPLIWAAADQAIRVRPDYADLRYYAAHAAVQIGDAHRARELLKDAVRLNPQYNDALILAGRLCLQQNDPEAAVANLQQALAGGADYADVHVMLGDAWQARGDLARAAEAYREALGKNADLAEARCKLAALPADLAGGRA